MSEPIEPEFYYSQSGAEVVGPVTAPALLDLLSSNKIDGDTLVTADGMNSWIPLAVLLKSELFIAASKNGEIPHDVAPPIRNPTLALGAFAALFTNPFTIALAAIGVPAYYLTRSKKRPPESILSALKPQKMREEEYLQNKLLPEPGTTGPKAVVSFAEKLAWSFGEFCTERAERERVRRLKEIRQQEAFKQMLRFPPQSLSGWVFYALVVATILMGGYFAFFFDQGGMADNRPFNPPQATIEPSRKDELPVNAVVDTEVKVTPSSQSTLVPAHITQDTKPNPDVLPAYPRKARLLKKYSIPLEYGVLGIRAGSIIQVTGKAYNGYLAVFEGEKFTVKDGDIDFETN